MISFCQRPTRLPRNSVMRGPSRTTITTRTIENRTRMSAKSITLPRSFSPLRGLMCRIIWRNHLLSQQGVAKLDYMNPRITEYP